MKAEVDKLQSEKDNLFKDLRGEIEQLKKSMLEEQSLRIIDEYRSLARESLSEDNQIDVSDVTEDFRIHLDKMKTDPSYKTMFEEHYNSWFNNRLALKNLGSLDEVKEHHKKEQEKKESQLRTLDKLLGV